MRISDWSSDVCSSDLALLSFGVEAHCLPKKHGGYEKAYKRRRFKLAAVPGPVMAAFHPSPWLIRNTDPLAKAGATLSAVRDRKSVASGKSVSVRVDHGGRRIIKKKKKRKWKKK